MAELHYAPGDVVFNEGDPSDFVCQIVSGAVEVVKDVGDQSVLLGRITQGEFVGEMGVIEGKPRGATVRAGSKLTVALFSKDEFLQRISGDGVLALHLLLRMSERLNAMNQAFAETAAPEEGRTDCHAPDGRVTVSPASDYLAAQLLDVGMVVAEFPFTVGRLPVRGESAPTGGIDLCIEDSLPFHMSRSHFRIEKLGDDYVVRDLDSRLGTQVNGKALGHHFDRDVAPLNDGHNLIFAGGSGSPFAFSVVLDPA